MATTAQRGTSHSLTTLKRVHHEATGRPSRVRVAQRRSAQGKARLTPAFWRVISHGGGGRQSPVTAIPSGGHQANEQLMSTPLLIVFAVLILVAGGFAFVFRDQRNMADKQLAESKQELTDTDHKLTEATRRLTEAQQTVTATKQQLATANTQITKLSQEAETSQRYLRETRTLSESREDTVEALQNTIRGLEAELKQRPILARQSYRIMTIGTKGSGKSSLTLKWANPLAELDRIEGTQSDRYERTVSNKRTDRKLTEHVFEIRDWGGEHFARAQAELVKSPAHALLLVVDLCGPDGPAPDEDRIRQQLDFFGEVTLAFFLSQEAMAKCQCIALFINKADQIHGTQKHAESIAREKYGDLIDLLGSRSKSTGSVRFKFECFVGSALSGQGSHHLFSFFVRNILPRNAYDEQLLEKLTEPPAPSPVTEEMSIESP